MLLRIGPTEVLVLSLSGGLLISSVVLTIRGVLDAAKRPDVAWAKAGRNKTLWIVLMIVSLAIFAPLGLAVSLFYLGMVRPKFAPRGELE